MIDTISPFPNQPVKNKKKNLAVLVGVFIIIAALIGGFFMLRQPKKTEEVKVAVVENKEPTPTEKPKIDKETVKFQVLNGTGTPGQAGIAVEALKKAGYNSDNIKTANAKDFNNTITTIALKEGFEDTANDVKGALKANFDEINIDSTQLDKNSEFDIIVTTGGKKFEETTPTSAATPSPTSASATSTPTPTPTVSPTPTP